MSKKMLIDTTYAEETRIVVVSGKRVEEFDFESANKRQISGNIYLAKVSRIEPSLQAAFVEYGGNRHGFLAFSEIHPDYYQIPIADREALLAEEKAAADALEADAEPDSSGELEAAAGDIEGTEGTAAENAGLSGQTRQMGGERDSPNGESVSGMELLNLNEGEQTDSVLLEELPEKVEEIGATESGDDMRRQRKAPLRRYKIQEVIKPRQILLIQVVKEERGNKGAAVSTYISLAGRFCVLMPNTARGVGISRKIAHGEDRKQLKKIANDLQIVPGAGLIIRTAGAQRSKAEIKRDYEYLQRLWDKIRDFTLKSTAPAMIYQEGDLIKRSIRDLYDKSIDEVLVAGNAGYRAAKDFMKMIMPSHAKNVQPYTGAVPLFAQYQVEGFLTGLLDPEVKLKSGGYIVIGVTEALVAIDVNSGSATRESSIEETALKTNLEAADEISRQLRLRDLAGLVVIDFIDMEERRNIQAVENRMKQRLRTDRARLKISRISAFGLMEISRQRLRSGLEEMTTQPCPTCSGTGLLRSDATQALLILRELEARALESHVAGLQVFASVSAVNFLLNEKRKRIGEIEEACDVTIRVEGDPQKGVTEYDIELLKNGSKQVVAPVSFSDSAVDTPISAEESDTGEEEKNKRRRRRRRRGGKGRGEHQQPNATDAPQAALATSEGAVEEAAASEMRAPESQPEAGLETETPKKASGRPKRTARRSKSSRGEEDQSGAEAAPTQPPATAEAAGEGHEGDTPAPDKPKRRGRPRKVKAEAITEKADANSETEKTAETGKPMTEKRAKTRKPQKADANSETEKTAETGKPQKADANSKTEKPATDEPAESRKPKKRAPSKKAKPEASAVEKDSAPALERVSASAEGADPKPPQASTEKASDGEEVKTPRKRQGWWSLGRF